MAEAWPHRVKPQLFRVGTRSQLFFLVEHCQTPCTSLLFPQPPTCSALSLKTEGRTSDTGAAHLSNFTRVSKQSLGPTSSLNYAVLNTPTNETDPFRLIECENSHSPFLTINLRRTNDDSVQILSAGHLQIWKYVRMPSCGPPHTGLRPFEPRRRRRAYRVTKTER